MQKIFVRGQKTCFSLFSFFTKAGLEARQMFKTKRTNFNRMMDTGYYKLIARLGMYNNWHKAVSNVHGRYALQPTSIRSSRPQDTLKRRFEAPNTRWLPNTNRSYVDGKLKINGFAATQKCSTE